MRDRCDRVDGVDDVAGIGGGVFPKAKFSALLRNGLLLAVFKLPITLGLTVVVGTYMWGVAHYPLPVLVLMTGLVGYLIWVGARSQSKELRGACAI